MADISAFLSQIINAARGETVRDAIVNSVEAMDEYGISAEKLVGNGVYLTKDDLVTKKEAQTAIITGKLGAYKKLYDDKISSSSVKAIKCSAAYKIWEPINKALDELLGEEN